MRCLDRAKMALGHVFPCIGIWFDPWDSFQVGFLPWGQTSNMAPFDHHDGRGKKSQTPFLVVRHRFRKVFWHRMGPLKENPTGYDEFYALWAFLSHSKLLTTVFSNPSWQQSQATCRYIDWLIDDWWRLKETQPPVQYSLISWKHCYTFCTMLYDAKYAVAVSFCAKSI